MSVVVGVGGRSGAPEADLAALLESALTSLDLDTSRIATVATLDRRAGDPAVRGLAARLGARLAAYPAATLARQQVPHPSELVRRHTGLAGVAEAAVLATGASLIGARLSSGSWTVAIGRLHPPSETH